VTPWSIRWTRFSEETTSPQVLRQAIRLFGLVGLNVTAICAGDSRGPSPSGREQSPHALPESFREFSCGDFCRPGSEALSCESSRGVFCRLDSEALSYESSGGVFCRPYVKVASYELLRGAFSGGWAHWTNGRSAGSSACGGNSDGLP
jgi:hypothetical protein